MTGGSTGGAMADNSDAELNRINISIKDLDEAHEYLKAYNEGLDAVIQRALLTAAIVAYSRPFKRSAPGTDKKSAVKISSEVEDLLDETQQDLHAKVIELRDKAVAHSDYDRKPTQRMPSAPCSVMMWSKTFDVLSENVDVDRFRDLAWKVHCLCIDRLFQIGKVEQSLGARLPPAVSIENGAMAVTEGELALRIKISDCM